CARQTLPTVTKDYW
nr:immunoglobulin heavy chain junction region [Macaca mulatta]MOY21849.1 immunoglobulin heavy chain junction region [Macaca mulatta]MOY22131.1 immunoglobulin heavy chain junction region [Macaca mulatta]MOY22152.1 immunoglobulin heavy chain junction region [Macaca mulatta]MOY22163.1 immunoglobulin heavy chain junction region [Macaca mulatta]